MSCLIASSFEGKLSGVGALNGERLPSTDFNFAQLLDYHVIRFGVTLSRTRMDWVRSRGERLSSNDFTFSSSIALNSWSSVRFFFDCANTQPNQSS